MRFGIVGAGMIGRIHAAAIGQLPGAELTGVMDNGRGTGQSIAPGTSTIGADSIDQFVSRDDIDIVTIATPSGTHCDIACAAAEAGKHVICEKPLDVNLARVDRMIAACDAAGVTLGGIFNTRHTRGARAVKAALDAGRFGRLTFGHALCPWWRDQSYYDESDWKGTWALDGGGAFMNQGIHSIDLLQWFMGEPVVSVSGYIASLAHADVEVEDTGTASLRFASGALGSVACTTSMFPGHFRTITIGGSRGSASLADGNLLHFEFTDAEAGDDALLEALGGLPGSGVGAANPSAGVDADGHAAVFRDFIEAVRTGRAPEVDGTEGRKAVALICAIYESSRRGGDAVVPGSS